MEKHTNLIPTKQIKTEQGVSAEEEAGSAKEHAYTLRPYQQEDLDKINSIEGRHVLVYATGLGKTLTGSRIHFDKRLLWLSHRDELVRQPEKYFDGTSFGIEKADEHSDGEKVVSASVQTLSRDNRLHSFDKDAFDVIVVDEAHHSAAETYKKILNYFKPKKVIGLTATPVRGDNVRLDDVFEDILADRSLFWGIKNKYLCPLRCVEVKADYSLKGVKKTAGDFNISDLDKNLNRETFFSAVRIYMEKCHKEKHTLIYCTSIRACELLLKLIQEQLPEEEKEQVAMISGKTDPQIRASILEGFQARKIRCIINCMVLTEGTDLPIADAIINIRPTCKKGLYQQIAGRATRLHDGKEYAVIYDIIPKDSSSSDRSLCTALSLFGEDMTESPEIAAKVKDEQEADIIGLYERFREEYKEKDALSLFLRSVNRFIDETESFIESAKEKGGMEHLAEEYHAQQEKLRENDDELDFKELIVAKRPDEESSYIMSPSYKKRITFSAVDLMGKTVLRIYDKTHTIFQKTLSFEDAVNFASDYCWSNHTDRSYLWNKDIPNSWKKQDATERQIAAVNKYFAGYHLDGNGHFSKADASCLIDIGKELKEKKELMKKCDPDAVKTKAAKKRRMDMLKEEIPENAQVQEDTSDELYEALKVSYHEKAKLKKAEENQKQELRKQNTEDILKKGYLLIKEPYPGRGPASERQVSYADSLYKRGECFKFDRKPDFSGMTKMQVSICIDLMKKCVDNTTGQLEVFADDFLLIIKSILGKQYTSGYDPNRIYKLPVKELGA